MDESMSVVIVPQPAVVTEPVASRRRALVVAMGSEEARQSGKKMAELLGYTPHGYNFEICTMLKRRAIDDQSTHAQEILEALNAVKKGMDCNDHLIVYLCLRNSKVEIDLQPILSLKTDDGKSFKKFLVILDLERWCSFDQDCFRDLDEGVVVLSMRGHDTTKAFRNGKYTYFSGLLFEALKGGAADKYGLITVANIYSYLQEATLMQSKVSPMLRSVMSESMLLRRVEGILDDRQLDVFCSAFPIIGDGAGAVMTDYIDLDTFTQNKPLAAMKDELIQKQLISNCVRPMPETEKPHNNTDLKSLFMPNWFIKKKDKSVAQPPVEATGFMLTAYGKHCRDMWYKDYFKNL